MVEKVAWEGVPMDRLEELKQHIKNLEEDERKLQERMEEIGFRLQQIESGELQPLKKPSAPLVLINDTIDRQRAYSNLDYDEVKYLRRCVGFVDNPGVLLALPEKNEKRGDVLISSCKTSDKAIKDMQFYTTIRVEFIPSTLVIVDCTDIVVLVESTMTMGVTNIFLVRCEGVRVRVAGDLPNVRLDKCFECTILVKDPAEGSAGLETAEQRVIECAGGSGLVVGLFSSQESVLGQGARVMEVPASIWSSRKRESLACVPGPASRPWTKSPGVLRGTRQRPAGTSQLVTMRELPFESKREANNGPDLAPSARRVEGVTPAQPEPGRLSFAEVRRRLAAGVNHRP